MNGSLNDGSQSERRPEPFPGAPALAFTFITVGAAYAFPFLLFAENHPLNGPISPEILNLNLLVAWMGLAHFVFAYYGQAKSLLAARTAPILPVLFCASLVVAGVLLGLIYKVAGAHLFDAVVWVYFIPHFIKAELHFTRASQSDINAKGVVLYWFPALGFAYFTAALFAPLAVSFNTQILLAGAAICVLAGLMGGVLRQLARPGYSTYSLLGFFFVGEGLVWGTYSKFMTPQFRQGLYVFHIAVASFYHYFRSYAFALRRLPAERVRSYLHLIVVTNLLLIVAGCWIACHPGWRWGQPLFGLSFFTFWVGLHLISSDVFTALKKFRQPAAGAAQ
jgi:hypothetical protein